MKALKMAREPGYCLHKPTGQAYVNLGGKVVYLGKHGTEESKSEYNRVKAEWLVNRHSAKYSPQATGPTVADLCLSYLDHAEQYYSTSEFVNLRMAMRPLSVLYATLPAKSFGVVEYRTVRDWWLKTPIDKAAYGKRKSANPSKAKARKPKAKPAPKPDQFRSRQYVNKCMKRLLRVFKWAVGQAIVPPNVHDALRCVEPLKRGRTTAPEAKPITCVESSVVDATLPFLTQVLADMVRIQQLVGCRPGELVRITPAMVDRSTDVWTIELLEHKTSYRGKSRTLYIGPQAQAILKPYLLRGADDACFSPQESERQRLDAKHDARVTPLSCGNRPGSNRIAKKPRQAPGTSYATGSYAKAIKYACQRGKIDHWHPNQLRHNAGTAIRKQFGIEAASTILGHSGLQVTQVYAEQDHAKAIEVARRIG